MAKEIDKTKENIGIDKLDEHTKKKLFNKFVEAGGEIVDDKAKKKQIIIDREKQKKFQQNLDGHYRGSKASQNKRIKKTATRAAISAKKEPSPFWGKLKTRILLKFYNIAEFNGYYLNKKFLQKFNNIYKPALIEIQMVYLEVFRSNPKIGNKVIFRLDKMKPLYYELIELISNVYDKHITDQIVEHYINFPDVPKKVHELKEQFMGIYRSLYILSHYSNTIFNSFDRAIELYIKLSEDKTSSRASMRKKIKNGLYVIFHKLYPRLHLLFCHYEGRYFQIDDSQIENVLNIALTDLPGKRVANDPTKSIKSQSNITTGDENAADSDALEDNEDNEEDKKEEISSIAVKKGFDIMFQLDPEKMRKEYDKEGLFKGISVNDKVFMTYLLYKEFDNEYSCILTTNKIKYTIEYNPSGKSDYREKMQDIYSQLRKPYESIRSYAETYNDYEKNRKERPTGSDQYVQHVKKLETIKKKKETEGRDARMNVKAFMDIIINEMDILLKDMDSKQRYIENPQDVLKFTTIEGNEKLNNRKVYEAISIAFYYASALASRLSPGGDLHGKLDLSDSEQTESAAITETQKTPTPQKDFGDESPKKSIFDELDDL